MARLLLLFSSGMRPLSLDNNMSPRRSTSDTASQETLRCAAPGHAIQKPEIVSGILGSVRLCTMTGSLHPSEAAAIRKNYQQNRPKPVNKGTHRGTEHENSQYRHRLHNDHRPDAAREDHHRSVADKWRQLRISWPSVNRIEWDFILCVWYEVTG
jgi:hypothetical protein